MNAKQNVRLVGLLSSVLLLIGCGDRSASGTYVSHTDTRATLLQLTETPDHRFTGTMHSAILNSDGHVTAHSTNVAGSVDNGTIVLTLQETPLPIGRNVSGTITANAIDLTHPVSQGSRTAVEHFERANLSEYDALIARLAQAGAPIIAERQRQQLRDAMNKKVDALAVALNEFERGAREIIARTPQTIVFYQRAVATTQVRWTRAQHLNATGRSLEQDQAELVVNQMELDKGQVGTTDDAIERVRVQISQQESALNAKIAQWNATCLDGSNVKPGDIIPDMGPCKGLSSAVSQYRVVLPQVHTALANVAEAKARGHKQLDEIWRLANVR